MFEEHSSSFSSPYLFNGKELDRETNLSYYGARYLDMKTSLWLNVDPLAEKYINIGSYVYCLNNPVMLVDPTGMSAVEPNRKASDGEVVFDNTDNTTYRGNKDGSWTLATQLDEVKISNKKSDTSSSLVTNTAFAGIGFSLD